jgi:Putative GTPase activating protein for Arf
MQCSLLLSIVQLLIHRRLGQLERKLPFTGSSELNNKLTKLQLGIFLCVRCASLHRKLGTHVSKVKSLSMDTWSSDQVDVSGHWWLSEAKKAEYEAHRKQRVEQNLQST